MCRIFVMFDDYTFYISNAHFFASLKQIPKVTTTFLLYVKYYRKINAKDRFITIRLF